MNQVDSVIQAVLYEGYMLYPYRASAVKNRQRWTFGGVYPRAYSVASGSDPWMTQTECLLCGDADARVTVAPGFLQVADRTVLAASEDLSEGGTENTTPWRVVPVLDVDDRRFHPWQEAVERRLALPSMRLGELLDASRIEPFAFAGSAEIELLADREGVARGALRRTHAALVGHVGVGAERVDDRVCRLTARIVNLTPLADAGALTRDAASVYALVSCHMVLSLEQGWFLSSMDPPRALAEASAACRNIGTWPVLVGQDGEEGEGGHRTMLASPIILYDFPQIAPESAGDLFDATEIDEILTLRILAMTDDEKREMAATDERARALLARTEQLGTQQLQKLHGAMRHIRGGAELTEVPDLSGDPGALNESGMPSSPWAGLDAGPRLACLRVGGMEIRVGDHVRLRPRSRADIFDMALNGQLATIESIERDLEDRVHVAVTVDCDPGKDFGLARMPGHRFFFRPDEIEPLGGAEAQA
ncbi:hypothetical protein AEMCBJ_32690 (plasmid) [Cupriavidus necator]|uniref:hypothetical protein n=1 Tax=Cupriavidus necator TaxID=106590 RepID=UPI003F734365